MGDDHVDRRQVYSQKWHSRAVLRTRTLLLKEGTFARLFFFALYVGYDSRPVRAQARVRNPADLIMVALARVFTSSHSEQSR